MHNAQRASPWWWRAVHMAGPGMDTDHVALVGARLRLLQCAGAAGCLGCAGAYSCGLWWSFAARAALCRRHVRCCAGGVMWERQTRRLQPAIAVAVSS
jgi:hypothetical protein